MTLAGSRLPRKTMLVGLMSVFILGNVLCAVAGIGVVGARLQEINRLYDPTNYFRHKLSIEPA